MNRETRQTCLKALDTIRLMTAYLECAGYRGCADLRDDPEREVDEYLHPNNIVIASRILSQAHETLLAGILTPQAQLDEMVMGFGVPDIGQTENSGEVAS